MHSISKLISLTIFLLIYFYLHFPRSLENFNANFTLMRAHRKKLNGNGKAFKMNQRTRNNFCNWSFKNQSKFYFVSYKENVQELFVNDVKINRRNFCFNEPVEPRGKVNTTLTVVTLRRPSRLSEFIFTISNYFILVSIAFNMPTE